MLLATWQQRYDSYMGRKRKKFKPTRVDYIAACLSLLTILGAFFTIVPVWTALTAGLAGLSVVIFVIALILLVVILSQANKPLRPILVAALCAGALGLIVPQAAYIRTAMHTGARLSFNMIDYVEFSGSTDLPATREYVYKSLPDRSLMLAFYESETPGNRPLVVLLHGGAWRYGNHHETGQWPTVLTDAGYDVASVEYRLSNDEYHTWQDAPADVHDAISYLRAHAEELSVDADAIHLFGQSAGGHLALLEAYRFHTVRSVTALYAPIDLTLDYETSRDKSAELDFIGGTPAEFSARYRAVSPIAYVDNKSPRSLLIQGKSDDLVHHENTRRLGKALDSHGVNNRTVFIPLTGHSFENQRGGFATQIATHQVLDFLNQKE